MIRNRTTRAAKAAFDLNSIYRWCLTGTPVMNTLGDLYPILHFLNISPQADPQEFRAHITKVEKRKPRLAADRMQVSLSSAMNRNVTDLQAILKTCSIRRNKDSTLNGVRLLNLPPKIISWDELELTPDERHIYTSIENRMKVKFNALLKRGTVLKHYSMVLVRPPASDGMSLMTRSCLSYVQRTHIR
jgi:SNF2 family DNA or RNA helicase